MRQTRGFTNYYKEMSWICHRFGTEKKEVKYRHDH
jgi:hypothetical protein